MLKNKLRNREILFGAWTSLAHPLNRFKVLKASDKVIEVCAKHKKSCWTQITELPDEIQIKKVIESGYTMTVLASDVF